MYPTYRQIDKIVKMAQRERCLDPEKSVDSGSADKPDSIPASDCLGNMGVRSVGGAPDLRG